MCRERHDLGPVGGKDERTGDEDQMMEPSVAETPTAVSGDGEEPEETVPEPHPAPVHPRRFYANLNL